MYSLLYLLELPKNLDFGPLERGPTHVTRGDGSFFHKFDDSTHTISFASKAPAAGF